ncbi:MAG: hypothetical protein UFE80_00380, partial [Christensenellales bacterium]|nr:hypothetical protein [Christensenellales bacterium]
MLDHARQPHFSGVVRALDNFHLPITSFTELDTTQSEFVHAFSFFAKYFLNLRASDDQADIRFPIEQGPSFCGGKNGVQAVESGPAAQGETCPGGKGRQRRPFST